MKEPRYIDCPVCGGRLSVKDWPFLEGEGTGRFIDCRKRCRSRTEPHVYERLRIEALTRQAEATLESLRRGDAL